MEAKSRPRRGVPLGLTIDSQIANAACASNGLSNEVPPSPLVRPSAFEGFETSVNYIGSRMTAAPTEGSLEETRFVARHLFCGFAQERLHDSGFVELEEELIVQDRIQDAAEGYYCEENETPERAAASE